MKRIRNKFYNSIEYTLNGKLHREDGPAVIENNGSMYWYQHGQLHREDGPAVIWFDGEMKWLINGEILCHKP